MHEPRAAEPLHHPFIVDRGPCGALSLGAAADDKLLASFSPLPLKLYRSYLKVGTRYC